MQRLKKLKNDNRFSDIPDDLKSAMIEYEVNLDFFNQDPSYFDTKIKEDSPRVPEILDPFPRQDHDFFDESEDSEESV